MAVTRSCHVLKDSLIMYLRRSTPVHQENP